MNNKTVNIQTMIELILMYALYFSLMKIVKTEFIKSIDITIKIWANSTPNEKPNNAVVSNVSSKVIWLK